MNYVISLRAEFLKIKRTSPIYFTILAASLVSIVMVLDNLGGANRNVKQVDWFQSYYAEGWMYIAFLILPMFIVLTCTLITQIEHKNNTWKQVLASPQHLYTILICKFIVLQTFIVAMLILHNVFMLAAALAIDVMYPDSGILSYLEKWDTLMLVNARTYIAALGISGLQFWLALRFRNFIVSLGIGVLLCFLGPLLIFEFDVESILGKLPFALSILVNIKKYSASSVFMQWLSVAYMLSFVAIAILEFNRKKVRA
jgi:hypothetical protein